MAVGEEDKEVLSRKVCQRLMMLSASLDFKSENQPIKKKPFFFPNPPNGNPRRSLCRAC